MKTKLSILIVLSFFYTSSVKSQSCFLNVDYNSLGALTTKTSDKNLDNAILNEYDCLSYKFNVKPNFLFSMVFNQRLMLPIKFQIQTFPMELFCLEFRCCKKNAIELLREIARQFHWFSRMNLPYFRHKISNGIDRKTQRIIC